MTDALGFVLERAHERSTASRGRSHEELRERVRDELASAELETPIRPALSKLVSDQSELAVDLLEGFETRRELLEWEQRLIVCSLGQLESSWFSRVACDPPTVSAMLGRAWGPTEALADELGLEIRRGILAKDLLPAFHSAIRSFRWSAVEHVEHLGDEGDAPEPVADPERQRYPAMRPELGSLERQQSHALEALLTGFESEEELLAWSIRAQRASYAELEAETASGTYFDTELRGYLLTPPRGDESRAQFVRESWAAEYLLPSYNRAAAALARRSTEVTATETRSQSTGSGSIS